MEVPFKVNENLISENEIIVFLGASSILHFVGIALSLVGMRCQPSMALMMLTKIISVMSLLVLLCKS